MSCGARVLLAGCGGGQHERFEPSDQAKTEAAKVLAAAPAKTRTEKTARTSFTVYTGSRKFLRATGTTRLDRELSRFLCTYETAVGRLKAGPRSRCCSWPTGVTSG